MRTISFHDAPGTLIPVSGLFNAKGKDFARYLSESNNGSYARIIECRRLTVAPSDVVVIEVSVERPQRTVHTILRSERLAVVFRDEDASYPEVLALRTDFPYAPHTNLREKNSPRSLCLYDQPYENVKLDWTPAKFLGRIRHWLKHTATGSLHDQDQNLEPLLLSGNQRIILPAGASLKKLHEDPAPFHIFKVGNSPNSLTFVARQKRENDQKQAKDVVAVVFSCPPQTHGTIKYRPETLEDLHEFCFAVGFDLKAELAKRAKAWFLENKNEVLNCKLAIILLLPKTRHAGGEVETTEQWAFLSINTFQDIAIALGALGTKGGKTGYIIGQQDTSGINLSLIQIATLQVLHGLSAQVAAAMNGQERMLLRIFAIGMGSLGSQIFNNLFRSGFGIWTLIDPDIFLPHNGARHYLGEWAIGENKAIAMAAIGNYIFDDEPVENQVKAIPCDFLNLGEHKAQVEKIYDETEVVLDFSASVAVSRFCASTKSNARHLSAFLSPSGKSLILLAEDLKREIRLDWLEMLHYREVLANENSGLELHASDGRFRYGNSCRDVSFTLSQDDAAIWAGIASKQVRRMLANDAASAKVFYFSDADTVKVSESKVYPIFEQQLGSWTIRYDDYILDRIVELRGKKLPNETGGVLLGHFDTHRRTCFIVEVVESPPDSEEWPTSYIRGCKDLQRKVREAGLRTLEQIIYVGEWHSHPRGAAVLPSSLDMQAYGWLSQIMNVEALPGIMMIIGDNRNCFLVSSETKTATDSKTNRKSKSK